MFKNTKVHIHDFPIDVQFRAEMYNLFNRVNLASPALLRLLGWIERVCRCFWYVEFDDWIGELLSGDRTGEPFNVQLALKLIF